MAKAMTQLFIVFTDCQEYNIQYDTRRKSDTSSEEIRPFLSYSVFLSLENLFLHIYISLVNKDADRPRVYLTTDQRICFWYTIYKLANLLSRDDGHLSMFCECTI